LIYKDKGGVLMFIQATQNLELTVFKEGKKVSVTLTPDQYYLLKRNGTGIIPVIYHDALISLADSNGKSVMKTELEFGQFNSPSNFCFVHRAYGKLDNGIQVDEVGEANPNNLDRNLSASYPAIMSNKRAQDRLLIRLLGLTGQVYSDVEFATAGPKPAASQPAEDNPAASEPAPKQEETPAPPAPAENKKQETDSDGGKQEETSEDRKMTVEEAENLVVQYGQFRNKPISLKELKENYPDDFDWLLNVYKVTSRSSQMMATLKNGAVVLAGK
jgi:hypothetical protein